MEDLRNRGSLEYDPHKYKSTEEDGYDPRATASREYKLGGTKSSMSGGHKKYALNFVQEIAKAEHEYQKQHRRNERVLIEDETKKRLNKTFDLC